MKKEQKSPQGHLKIELWNVGHGTAISVVTPRDQIVLFDLGKHHFSQAKGSYKSFSPLQHILKKYPRKEIAALFITHPHMDHLEDLPLFFEENLHRSLKHFYRPEKIGSQVLDELTQRAVAQNRSSGKYTKALALYKELNAQYKKPYIRKHSPLNPRNNGGVTFEVFRPVKAPEMDIDANSLVTIIGYAGWKMLIPGDNTKRSWRELMKRSDFRKSLQGVNFFLTPHHARRNALFKPLLELMQPDLIFVTDKAVGPTNASDEYRRFAKGYPVFKRDSPRSGEPRKCLTTRKDNKIQITISEEMDPRVNVFPLRVQGQATVYA